MIEELFSPYWYRVKDLQPRLKPQVDISWHIYRGQDWFIVRDPVGARSHRFSSSAYRFVSLMDGERSVESIWNQCNEALGDDAPGQNEIITLLSKLHAADLMLADVSPALGELLKRGIKRERAQRSSHYKNPAALRFPLVDPDKFLSRTQHLARPLFTVPVLVAIGLLSVIAALQAASNWNALNHAISEQALQPYNIALLVLLYPIVKLLHELAHAYSVKLEGGEVHELGVMLLVLMPIPYVDASASSTFSQRRKRILVSAAGMIVELGLSAIAMLLWLVLEDGVVRSMALNVVLIGGVSTLLFNGNPLLRYDAYYMLVDAIGIPNLAQRSNRYLGYLIQRYCFKIEGAHSPVSARGEPAWFVFYSIASFLYRTVLMLVISLYLAGKMFVLGVLLALWMMITQFALPIAKLLGFLLSDRLGPHRSRALGVSGLAAVAFVLLLTAVPMPSNTQHEGVVWLPGDARINADVDAMVHRVLVKPGQLISKGQGIVELDDPERHANLAIAQAELKELQALRINYLVSDRIQAAAIEEKIRAAEARVAHAQDKVDDLLVTSPADGRLAMPYADDLAGSLVKQGQLLAYLKNNSNARIQLVVDQADQDRIQHKVDRVQVRLSSSIPTIITANIAQQTPKANNVLPSKVLGTTGGGTVMVDPGDETGKQSLDAFFQYELEIPLAVENTQLGTRAYVRFDHGTETISQQLVRRTRQLFLKHFNA
ncbi:MAG: biotin/lipoyl-binding protein [Pseudomonadota bacterium]